MSLSQVSCAVFARGLRALSMQLQRTTGAQDHPKASSCFQCSAAEGSEPAEGSQPMVEGTCELPLLVSAPASVATRAGSVGDWALWGKSQYDAGEMMPPQWEKSVLREGRNPSRKPLHGGHDDHADLSPSHLLVLLQKRSWESRRLHCTVKGNNNIFGKCWVIKCRFPCPIKVKIC